MAGETKASLIAAMAGNIAIAISKGFAAAYSGSSAMLSEAIHSLVDTANGGLLLFGQRRSKLPADRKHPFGRGHELYFWSLIVGVLIFGLGGGMSIFSGWHHITSPQPIGDARLSYIVLGAATLFEGISWVFGWRAFRKERRGRGVVETIVGSKDPTTFSVLLEDSAALAGLAFAFAGVYASQSLGIAWMDGAASVMIGLLLCCVAVVMMNESRKLLVGEGVESATLEVIRAIGRADSDVEEVGPILTMYLGPDEVMLVAEVHFRRDPSVDVRAAAVRLTRAIQAKYPKIRRISFDAGALADL